MTLRLKERELVAVGASLAAGCRPCTDYHVKAAREAKLDDVDLRRAMNVALAVRRDALEVMQAYGLQHLGDAPGASDGVGAQSVRTDALVAVAAAIAVNCTTNLERHLAAARNLGVNDDEIADIAKLATFIRGKATAHVEKLLPVEERVE